MKDRDRQHWPFQPSLNPGDETAPGTQGAGEDLCPECGGNGRIKGSSCPVCNGTGSVVVEGIRGA